MNDARVKRIRKIFTDPLTEVLLLFLQSFLPLLTGPNLKLQHETPQIHQLYDILVSAVNKIMSRFSSADLDVENIDLDCDNLPMLDGEDNISIPTCMWPQSNVIIVMLHNCIF